MMSDFSYTVIDPLLLYLNYHLIDGAERVVLLLKKYW